jgi:hypothetical protein
MRQISLARISVPAGATAITASMITDERMDKSVCGIVTETVQVDTSTMQSQFEALLTAIQEELQNLNAGTAALLKTGDTMQGTLDMGGNKIKNVATPTDDNDAVSKKFLNDALNEQLSMELLWENASPTSSIASGTEVNFSITENDLVIIIFREGTGAASTFSAVGSVGQAIRSFGTYDGRIIRRMATVTATGVRFGKGQYMASYPTVTDDNAKAIPIEIFVIRGVR